MCVVCICYVCTQKDGSKPKTKKQKQNKKNTPAKKKNEDAEDSLASALNRFPSERSARNEIHTHMTKHNLKPNTHSHINDQQSALVDFVIKSSAPGTPTNKDRQPTHKTIDEFSEGKNEFKILNVTL